MSFKLFKFYTYKAVVEEVRKRLGNPRMNLTVEKIDITYFAAI